MSVYVSNITINSKSDFSQEFNLIEKDNSKTNLKGCTIFSHIRKHPESSKIVAEFLCEIINESEGTIKLSLDSNTTASIKEGRYVYDVLVVTINNTKSIVIEGNVLVRSGISN